MKRRLIYPNGTYELNWKILKSIKWTPFKMDHYEMFEEDGCFTLRNISGYILYQYIHANADSMLLNFDDLAKAINALKERAKVYERCAISVITNFPCSYFTQEQLLSLPSSIRYLMLATDYNWVLETVDKINLTEWEFRSDR
ncbi:MAG: hypothetical protein EOP51_09715 [Sphingobacteriales bacterium]|nr:MAG: hypothetical protein EOP51_09715 [Sphingobacteriales bacterium]